MSRRQISFCFDDGFRRSADAVRRIFDARGLSACFCVLSAPELTQDPGIRGADIADWDYWRGAVAAGHEVAPHGHAHELYARLDPDVARRSIETCWETLERELPGFRRERSVFHLPYLSAPGELVEWIAARALGVRLALGRDGLNGAAARTSGKVDCACFGPDRVGAAAAARLKRFADETGWLALVFHGLDGEGWGPIAEGELIAIVDAALAMGATIGPPNRLMLNIDPRSG